MTTTKNVINNHLIYEYTLTPNAFPDTLKHDDPLLRQGFTQIPNIILKDSLLSPQEKVLYALLLMYSWQDKHCFPGQDILAKSMGCTPLTIKRTLKKLVHSNLIRIKRQGLNKPNVYFIRKLTDAYPLINASDPGGRF